MGWPQVTFALRKFQDRNLAKKWQRVVAEFLGTLLFIFAVSGSVTIPERMLKSSIGETQLIAAFIQGIALVVTVSIFGGISGSHFNPAITLTSILIRTLSPLVGLLYVCAQLLGAMAGAGVFRACLGWNTAGLELSRTSVGTEVSLGQAFLIEFLITSILIFAAVSTGTDTRKGLYILAPIPIGFSVLFGVLIARTLTGASMNPARSFGPAVVMVFWKDHWIYWVSPLCSSIFVAAVYELIMYDNLLKGNTETNSILGNFV